MEKNELERLRERFIQFLILKQLSYNTLEQYLKMFNLFPHDTLTQEATDQYLHKHNSSKARAFLLNYFKMLGIKHIDLPSISGRKKKRIINPITPEERTKLRKFLYDKNMRHGIMFDLLYEGGIRIAEIGSINSNSIEWNSWLKNTSLPCRVHVIGKGDKERVVLISPETARIFAYYIRKFIQIQEDADMDKPIFSNKDGTSISEGRIWKIINMNSKLCLGRAIRPHEIRHQRADDLYEMGIDIRDLSSYLGHSNIATTEIYLHKDTERSLNKIADFLTEKTEEE